MGYHDYLSSYHEQIIYGLAQIMGFNKNEAYKRILAALPKRDRQKAVVCLLTGQDENNKSGLNIEAMKHIHLALTEYQHKDRTGLIDVAWYSTPTSVPYTSPDGRTGGYVGAYRMMESVLGFFDVKYSRRSLRAESPDVIWIGKNRPQGTQDCTVVTCTERQGAALAKLIESIEEQTQKAYDIGLRNGSDWLTNMAQGALSIDQVNNFEMERARAKSNTSG